MHHDSLHHSAMSPEEDEEDEVGVAGFGCTGERTAFLAQAQQQGDLGWGFSGFLSSGWRTISLFALFAYFSAF